MPFYLEDTANFYFCSFFFLLRQENYSSNLETKGLNIYI